MWDGLLLPFLVEPGKHLLRLAGDPEYRAYSLLASRLGRTPRFTPRTLRRKGKPLQVPDVPSFLSAYREIFVERCYRFSFPGGAPRILDLGANIGLSALYFKELFPQARVTAYEADPEIFRYLRRNIDNSGVSGVELVQGAVWHRDGVLSFQSEGGDGGRVAAEGDNATAEVPAFDIRRILASSSYDVVKMDIEGAEGSVLEACRGLLGGISQIFLEFHSTAGRPQQLHGILALLSEAGFRYYLESVHHTSSPALGVPVYGGFDLQLNIVAWREKPC